MEQTHNCLNCGVEITPPRPKIIKKFCSKNCRWTHWTKNNKERVKATTRKYRKKRYEKDGYWRDSGQKAKNLRSWMIELKSKPCNDCKNTFEVCCMDFDHRIDAEKKYNIGSMFAHHYSRELIKEELKKCDLVCSNCHRIRTKNKRIGNGKYKICGIPKNGETL